MDDRSDHLPEKVAVFINPACEVAKRRPRQAFTDKNGSEVYDSQFAPYHVDESGRDIQPDDLLNLGRYGGANRRRRRASFSKQIRGSRFQAVGLHASLFRRLRTKNSNVTDSDIIYGSLDRSNPQRSEALALAAARTIGDNQCHHLVVLDMTKLTALFDYHVIATGTSGRQLRAVAEEIEQALESEFGETKLSLAGKDDGHWIILDFGTIVIHLFDEETRAFYSLENLWAEATKVDLSQVVSPQSLAKSLDD